MNTSVKPMTTNGRPDLPTQAKPVSADIPLLLKDDAAVKTKRGSNLFSSLIFNGLLPIAILLGGAAAIAAFGSIAPKSRDADDQTLAGRMQRLAAADVSKVLALSEIDKPLELRVDGVVVPYLEIALAAEVSGRIVKKSPACEAGNFVKKGDFLIEIDSVDYQQSVDRLTRMREQDYEAVKEVDQETANTQRMVTVASEDVTIQEREVNRLSALPEGFASQGELDKAKKSLLMAVQSRIGYENQLSLLAARRSKLEASERLATTELKGAEINLERTKIYSPVDGVIVRENAELNSFIQRGSPIVTLDDISKAEVAVNLRMDQLHWVLDQQFGKTQESRSPITEAEATPGDSANAVSSDGRSTSPGYALPPTPAVIEYAISGRNDKTYRWDGTLVRYDGIGLDTRSRTVPVRIVVDKPRQFMGSEDSESFGAASPSPLVRGMFVTVRLLIRPKTSLIAIPSLAIQPGNRVWQFTPDDSVLELGKSPATNQASPDVKKEPVEDLTSQSNALVPPAETGTTDDVFDPSKWRAGRVIVRRGIVPVDSLWLSTPDDVAVSVDGEPKERRYWICEVTGGEMAGGDWVVSSPLSEFDSQIPVRVPVSDLK